MLVAWAVIASGCAAVPDTPPPAVDAAAPTWIERSFEIRGGFIRGTLLVPEGASADQPRPAVVNPVVPDEALTARGFVVARYRLDWSVLAPERPARETASSGKPPAAGGKTVGVWLLASPSADVIGQSYFRLISSDGAAAVEVVDYLRELAYVDGERIGIAGVSTNGFKVYAALMAGARLRAAVIVGACADYHSFLADSPVALGGAALELDPEYERWLSAHEAVRQVDRFTGTALLLVNGGRDHVIPNHCVDGSIPTLRQAYARAGGAERIRQSWWPKATHNELVAVATEDILAWWDRWLASPAD